MIAIRTSAISVLCAAFVSLIIQFFLLIIPASAQVITIRVNGNMSFSTENPGPGLHPETYTGNYTFDLTLNLTPPPTITITQVSGPGGKTDGWFATIPVTDEGNGYFKFDASNITYYIPGSSGVPRARGKGTFVGALFGPEFYFNYRNNGTKDDWTFASVPEVSTWAMMLVGFGGLGLAGRRRTWSTSAT